MTQPVIHPLADVHTTTIGASTRIWQFVVVLAGAKIGQDCNICSHCLIENDVVIGDRVTVKSGVQLWYGLRVGDDVFIVPNVTLINGKFPRSKQYTFSFAQTALRPVASIEGGVGTTTRHNHRHTGHGCGGCRGKPLGASWSHRSWQPRPHSGICWSAS